MYPTEQTHSYESGGTDTSYAESKHVAPLWHGEDRHSSRSSSHTRPWNPGMQEQTYVSTSQFRLTDDSEHAPPFAQGCELHSSSST